MTKAEFEKIIEQWIIEFINSDRDLTLITIFKNKNISRVSHPILNSMPQAKLCDFNCDFCVLVKHANIGYQLILINRFTKSIGIKDIGEMLIYAKISVPLYAFLISINGHSTEINNILVNEVISLPLFKYDNEKYIILFALNNKVKEDSVLPIYVREFFYEKIGNT